LRLFFYLVILLIAASGLSTHQSDGTTGNDMRFSSEYGKI
jgi:hypothetical protein